MGGAGSAVLEALQKAAKSVPVLQLGLPDRFIDQGDPGIQLAHVGLNKEGIVKSIRSRISSGDVRQNPGAVIFSVVAEKIVEAPTFAVSLRSESP